MVAVSDIDIRFAEALAFTRDLGPADFSTFCQHLDPVLIEEALHATGSATLLRRRLPVALLESPSPQSLSRTRHPVRLSPDSALALPPRVRATARLRPAHPRP